MFQSSVAATLAAGVPGELFKGSFWRVQPGVIDSDGVTNGPNLVGAVYTQTVGVDMHCKLGGTPAEGAAFYGILVNPKEYVNFGTVAGGPLGPTLALPQYAKGSFCRNSTGLFVTLQAAANVDDFVDFDVLTGLIYPRARFATTGVGTLAIASNVGTIASAPAGMAPIGVGTIFNTLSGPATVLSLGTGTGGNGTYNLSPITNQAATANTTFSTAPATGRAEIPNARVQFYNIPAAGLGVISLNN